MTTIVFDGKTVAADTLAVDHYGLRSTFHKIIENKEWLAGLAGDLASSVKWEKATRGMTLDEVLDYGYPTWVKDTDDPAMLLIERETGTIWKHYTGVFCAHHGVTHAIGSGRDYALAAMYLGKNAKEAVQVAAHFDNYTGSNIDEVAL